MIAALYDRPVHLRWYAGQMLFGRLSVIILG